MKRKQRPPWWFAPAILLGSVAVAVVVVALIWPFVH